MLSGLHTGFRAKAKRTKGWLDHGVCDEAQSGLSQTERFTMTLFLLTQVHAHVSSFVFSQHCLSGNRVAYCIRFVTDHTVIRHIITGLSCLVCATHHRLICHKARAGL